MAEIVVDVPDELSIGFKHLGKNEANEMICNALREHLSEKLMFKFADELF